MEVNPQPKVDISMSDSALEVCPSSQIKYDLRTDEAKIFVDRYSLGLPQCSDLDRETIKFSLRRELRSIANVSFEGRFIVLQMSKTLQYKEHLLNELRLRILFMLRHMQIEGMIGSTRVA